MTEPRRLRLGTDGPSPTIYEEETRIAVLQATVPHYLPGFDSAIEKAIADARGGSPVLILHQDAFAAGYDDDEYTLLGMAIKYAGLRGVTVQVMGKNGAIF
ncbi:MAG: hypothetical protein JNL58_22050 [Planctomyces sp.]|nr:hypothetical protein [Planctomyces sp.]